MKRFALTIMTISALAVAACGRSSDDDAAPPTNRDDSSDDAIALESGTYYIERLWDLEDGCAREPLQASDPITAVPFSLTNDGSGRIVLDRCLHEGRSLSGDVTQNRGTLSVRHGKRRDGSGDHVAEYEQECRLELNVKDVNTFEGTFTEYQRNRNDLMRAATVDAESCSTSYKLVMTKR